MYTSASRSVSLRSATLTARLALPTPSNGSGLVGDLLRNHTTFPSALSPAHDHVPITALSTVPTAARVGVRRPPVPRVTKHPSHKLAPVRTAVRSGARELTVFYGTVSPMTMAEHHRYPIDWPFLSWNIVVRRAGGRCECSGECGRDPAHLEEDVRCRNRHGQPRWRGQPWQRPVILSAAHLEHDPSSRDLTLIAAYCESCHLAYDRAQHAATKQARREARLGLLPLFELA